MHSTIKILLFNQNNLKQSQSKLNSYSLPTVYNYFIMNQKRSISLVQYFLKHSPKSQFKQYTKVFTAPHIESKPPAKPLPNRVYLNGFL